MICGTGAAPLILSSSDTSFQGLRNPIMEYKGDKGSTALSVAGLHSSKCCWPTPPLDSVISSWMDWAHTVLSGWEGDTGSSLNDYNGGKRMRDRRTTRRGQLAQKIPGLQKCGPRDMRRTWPDFFWRCGGGGRWERRSDLLSSCW